MLFSSLSEQCSFLLIKNPDADGFGPHAGFSA